MINNGTAGEITDIRQRRVNIEVHKSPNQRGPVLKTICRCGAIGKVHAIKCCANGRNILFRRKKSHLKSHITSTLHFRLKKTKKSNSMCGFFFQEKTSPGSITWIQRQ